ncbi:hypothetical protein WMY93_012659 [Mugilogobius chulae]|uniref:Uncharacterized protein n=1 Tax=Mugilogobius chulae TaxID=88201 RepID=A0AAW0NXV6_9GOBI
MTSEALWYFKVLYYNTDRTHGCHIYSALDFASAGVLKCTVSSAPFQLRRSTAPFQRAVPTAPNCAVSSAPFQLRRFICAVLICAVLTAPFQLRRSNCAVLRLFHLRHSSKQTDEHCHSSLPEEGQSQTSQNKSMFTKVFISDTPPCLCDPVYFSTLSLVVCQQKGRDSRSTGPFTSPNDRTAGARAVYLSKRPGQQEQGPFTSPNDRDSSSSTGPVLLSSNSLSPNARDSKSLFTSPHRLSPNARDRLFQTAAACLPLHTDCLQTARDSSSSSQTW